MQRRKLIIILCLLFGLCGTATAWWQPKSEHRIVWQWQLQGTIDTSVNAKMYDVDLFDTTQTVIDKLHKQGKIVICYFSAGTAENWRDDYKNFPKQVLGNSMDNWPAERWLDIRNFKTNYAGKSIENVMLARLNLAKQKHCDGVEPDNVDAYQNNSGFRLSNREQITYDTWLAKQSHQRGLSVGLKNAVGLADALVSKFDWALNEQCYAYNECGVYMSSFINANKAVFWVEYQSEMKQPFAKYCAYSKALHLNFLDKNMDLNKWYKACSSNYNW